MKPTFLLTVLSLCLFPVFLRAEALPDAWERQVLAACLILEAADQGEAGMQAVAAVIRNRSGGDASKFIAVVKKPYAFSALNASTVKGKDKQSFAPLVSRASKDINWSKALSIVDALYSGELSDNTFGADHYSRKDELPSWSHGMRATTVIGDHLFFKSP
ncbi:cell wall hydrolase [Pelagicoccus sp. NFK12]|uniref:Cell wall hydrolase n=1 Tax=Pelagicoccus enzymogenes TaxID=2773457 RepID=A0A927F9H4_9BACT|nr:cell wall hydrolase [Pelagicoccus enzymogenes]MBD5780319.1 cell wall hydrolase [Pelagicoccus enzymogenes]MDQ8197778.1 cell wall hydrolase [Pelagicoccus enzymogenes]